MRNAIIELLNRADERKLRLIYFYARALIGKDAEVTPVISITDTDLRLSENALNCRLPSICSPASLSQSRAIMRRQHTWTAADTFGRWFRL